MNRLKWFFMGTKKKLEYNIEVCYENEQNLHLDNGIILNFSDMTIGLEKMDYKVKDDVKLNDELQKLGFKYCGNFNRGDGWYRDIPSFAYDDEGYPVQGILVRGDCDNRKISFRFPFRDNIKRKSVKPYISDLIEAGLIE